jgi:hypothetical protein
MYSRRYPDLASGLRDLSRGYIRLFVANNEQMFATYTELQGLASRWDYKDGLVDSFQEYTDSLSHGSNERLSREAKTKSQSAEAHQVTIDTAKYLSDLAHRAAAGMAMPR